MVIIKNDSLTVKIAEKGAEILSVTDKCGKEFIWGGDEKFWSGHAPVAFPLCSRLKDDIYYYEGKPYSMGIHGFAQNSLFETESYEEDRVVFLLCSDDETKKMYPFDFEFRVKFELTQNKLEVIYEVKNVSDGKMYFNVGAHEGYDCPGGVSDYTLVFDEEEDFVSTQVNEFGITYKTDVVAPSGKVLPLKDDFFKIDALVFVDVKSRGVTLQKNDGTRKIRVEYPDFPTLLIWTAYGAPYVCIEPWTGLPEREDTTQNIEKRERINIIDSGEVFSRTHTITFD